MQFQFLLLCKLLSSEQWAGARLQHSLWYQLALHMSTAHHHIFIFAKKSRRATRKAEAHHTLVAHYIMIVNMRIKHTTHISTYKHSKQVYHSTHYTLTHRQTQSNHLKCRSRSTLLVTVLLTVYNYKELITFTWYVQDYCSVILPAGACLAVTQYILYADLVAAKNVYRWSEISVYTVRNCVVFVRDTRRYDANGQTGRRASERRPRR